MWRQRLRDLVVRRLLRDDHASFNNVLLAAAGADPLLVRALLVELVRNGIPKVRLRATSALADSERVAAPHQVVCDLGLPAPHPLDYEWRFTPGTREELVRRALNPEAKSLLLLGCPTIALATLIRRPDLRVTLVDDNPALPPLADLVGEEVPAYHQLRADLVTDAGVTAGTAADVVIADAPFYPDAMAGFLRAAAIGARPGASLMFVLPPFGCRPSAEADARWFLQLAKASGFDRVTTISGGVRYLRPRFEARAHRSAGLLSVAEDWRVADLAVFRFVGAPPPARTVLTSDRALWREVVVGGKRWRVKSDPGGSTAVEGLGLLRGVADDFVLDSVSNRDRRRQGANVCTDDNEFFVTSNPSLLLDVLDSVVEGHDPVEAVERKLGRILSPDEFSEVVLVRGLVSGNACTG